MDTGGEEKQVYKLFCLCPWECCVCTCIYIYIFPLFRCAITTQMSATHIMHVYTTCVSVYQGFSLSVQLLSSTRAWPTFYCTVVLILYECAAACSGHCRSTRLFFHIVSTGGQQRAQPASPTEN